MLRRYWNCITQIQNESIESMVEISLEIHFAKDCEKLIGNLEEKGEEKTIHFFGNDWIKNCPREGMKKRRGKKKWVVGRIICIASKM